MAHYYVKVKGEGDQCYVLASLPTGAFTAGPMPQKAALRLALDLQAKMRTPPRPSWHQRIWNWVLGRDPEEGKEPAPESVPRCALHPAWDPVLLDGVWICGFCRKDLS
jgi:hypothetical protein